MALSQPQFEKHLTTPDLPAEVGEYISDLRKQLDTFQPRMDELVAKGPDNLTNEEIDELTKLNNEASKILVSIRRSRDEKRIINLEEDEVYEELISKLSPEAKVERYNITIGGKTKDELIQELENRNDINFKDEAKYLINQEEFTTSKEVKNLKLVRLTVEDLGFPDSTTTNEIFKRADELGLDLCEAEVGPQFLLQSDISNIKEKTLIGIKQIAGFDRDPVVSSLNSNGRLTKLRAGLTMGGFHWNLNYHWMFALRPLNKGMKDKKTNI